MRERDEGLTKTYNRVHDVYETDPRVAKLRELQSDMDKAVRDSYGWTDIPTDCDFHLDYKINEVAWGSKNKPYRYRWPDSVRDEVVARLLGLKTERAADEGGIETAPRTVTRDPNPSGHWSPAHLPGKIVANPGTRTGKANAESTY